MTKNYRPISLLPICCKIFECLIFNESFTFFTDNNLISPNQSGFRPGYSCINQLIGINNELYKSFGRHQRLFIKYGMKDYFPNYL